LKHGQDAIFAADLKNREMLRGKMELLRQRSLLEAQEFIELVHSMPTSSGGWTFSWIRWQFRERPLAQGPSYDC